VVVVVVVLLVLALAGSLKYQVGNMVKKSFCRSNTGQVCFSIFSHFRGVVQLQFWCCLATEPL
jgi:hypothetical protein